MFRPIARLLQAFHLARGRLVELDLSPYRKILDEIDRFNFEGAADDLLQATSAELATQSRDGVSRDRLLPQAFALVREASRRVLGLRPFDVQVIAATAMHQGKLVEMQTGEGKTLAAVLPACLNALAGRGVHVLTFNDYLAARDAEWMGPVYRFLGLTVGSIQQGMSSRERVDAYSKDVTYVTAKETGFDYLRDQLCTDKSELVHRPFHFAIVDEADSILIDESRVPLVIAGSTSAPEMDPYRAAELVSRLDPKADFRGDEFSRNIHFTEAGLDRLEVWLGCGSLHDAENLQLLTELSLALHAAVLLRPGIDYIVRDSKVEIVDEFTGRVVENRRWPDGLQAAVEAKENVPLQPQGMIRGSITLQHYLRLYPRVCGMTATAQPAAEEFQRFYDLKVVVIPPNRRCRRLDRQDRVFTHKEAKRKALVQEIARLESAGRPVLVGTSSVAESEELARDLSETGISCQVLNPGDPKTIAGSIRAIADELKERSGWFGELNGSLRFIVAAMLLQNDDRAADFMVEVDRVRGLFRTARMRRGGSYEVMAVLVLRGSGKAPVGTADLERFKAIYEAMRKHHWWITGVADFPACAILVGQNDSPEVIGQEIEAIYQELHSVGFKKGDPLQTAANLLYLAREKPSTIASRYYALAEAFRRESTRIWQSEYDELAILSFLKHPAAHVVEQVLRNQQAIRELTPKPDRSLAFNLASSITFVDLIQSHKDVEGVTDAKAMMDMQAIINAQQAAMIAATTAAVAASSATSSASSG